MSLRSSSRKTPARRRAAMLASLAGGLFASIASADVFVVNSTNDDGDLDATDGICWTGNQVGSGSFLESECTLRAAIEEANLDVDRDRIEFSSARLYDLSDSTTITPPATYLALINPVDIDGTTAPDWSDEGLPNVRLVGTGFFPGLLFYPGSDGSTVRGLAFQNFTYGVFVLGSDDVWIDSCAFGYWVAPDGSEEGVDANLQGIRVGSGTTGTTIGMRIGPGPGSDLAFLGNGNLVSGNVIGIGTDGENTRIIGNRIGTDRAGRSVEIPPPPIPIQLGNLTGIQVEDLSGLEIGDVLQSTGFPVEIQAGGNVISGNAHGIHIVDDDPDRTALARIVANQIGSDVDGETSLPNTFSGIWIEEAHGAIEIGEFFGPNLIGGNWTDGIEVGEAVDGAVTILGNRIGVGFDDVTAIGNGERGIDAEGGDPLSIVGNLVGYSGADGIRVDQPATLIYGGPTIEGNRVGTNYTGDALPNVGPGIAIESEDATIASNVVGASEVGILIGPDSRGFFVLSNYVGTDETGADLGNTAAGIESKSNFGHHRIGDVAAGNIVGWNGESGIVVDVSTRSNEVVANLIGVDPTGRATPNAHHGILVRGLDPLAERVLIGSDIFATPIELEERANHIAHNERDGVTVEPGADAEMRGNRFEENHQLAIDLGGLGPTPNDPGDLDLGANRLQNYPELDAANSFYDRAATLLQVEYRVPSSIIGSRYDLTVDFYLADATGFQPMSWLGSHVYPAADAGQTRTVQFNPATEIPPTGLLVATATDLAGRTSEVSPPVLVPEPGVVLGLVWGALGLGPVARRRRRAHR